jgi:hypothetical protein
MTSQFLTSQSLGEARQLLCALQDSIRDAIIAARNTAAADTFADIAEVTAADTIYHIDKISEEAICAWFNANWPAQLPVQLMMEGVEEGDAVTFPEATPISSTVWKCILDPSVARATSCMTSTAPGF